MRIRINVTGIVQGVGFRPFIYRIATENGLTGYVRNRGDAGVEIVLEGTKQGIMNFQRDLKNKKPDIAQIHDIIIKKLSGKNKFKRFTIYKSSEERELSGSVIPPDLAICDECLMELRDLKNPRYEYFFITCTNCGPRFTIIEKLPYDRENTTMRNFQKCAFCNKEYNNPLNRRFHAQTVACPECGPRVWLTDRNGEPIHHENPVHEAGKLLSEGFVLAVKGYGGFHIAASAILEKPLLELRKTKHRRSKPFAIMARSIEATKIFAEVEPKEEEFLTSNARPIVLLKKTKDYNLSELVAPGLHNIGVMLPYTGLHAMLFDKVTDIAFVMTSANPPNQPIVKENTEAINTLGKTVDYFLFHDRKIAYRCDDSVLRVNNNEHAFLRRSRGYAPAPIIIAEDANRCTLSLGGELNNTSCVLLDNKAFLSQHLGDVENLETIAFLEEATKHLIRLTNAKVEMVCCDLHPKFNTTLLAKHLAEQNNWQLLQIQHHYAHAAALMIEHSVDEIIGIVCDGYGYGTDGEAWGGEILFVNRNSPDFDRVAHLEAQPLLGGDAATRFPLRIAAAILSKKINIDNWLFQECQHLPHGETEAKIMLSQLKSGSDTIKTTSCGRILDAVSALTGVCYERTYEGEPAMKLESSAMKGVDVLKLEPSIDGNVLATSELIEVIYENLDRVSVSDLAYSAHAYLARGLASLAINKALERGVDFIGFSGGVAYNEMLTQIMRQNVENAGLKFLVHKEIPAGDGGLSFGQAVVGGILQLQP